MLYKSVEQVVSQQYGPLGRWIRSLDRTFERPHLHQFGVALA